ncbi:redox-regulated ATPase YchF [Buchnera aphidicola]|uniref:GTP-binding protein n=1 Tax=Buchnera aphidicola subsp. Cinara cedri (strain Cc) TaxID=372461 RepID=Q057U9_BUCCC|nr:redox-regulated ATPase YchF [Buchnera aphidicola]ABJ90600.1 GTP-binding protein [Buchnera aphidicola BCc]
MVYKFGIIGLPNVGKSALFNKITKLNVPSKNFPFCTIKPNIGIISIFDNRLINISNNLSSKNIIYSCVKIIDIAGLVKGASLGEGLGNKFLENIRDCHAIIHVVRCFKNNNIIHIYNDINPIRDIDIINTELLFSDLNLCEKIFKKKSINNKIKNSNQYVFLNLIKYCIKKLQQGYILRDLNFTQNELKILKQYRFLTLKPMIYVFNISNDITHNINLNIFLKNNNFIKSNFISISIENLDTSKIYHVYYNKIIRKLCSMLDLCTFFTAGSKEARSWIFKKESTAKQVAKLIHTDFFRGFIRAQVISYDEFIKYGNLNIIRKLGRIRSEGKNYIVKDGDIINFLFNI